MEGSEQPDSEEHASPAEVRNKVERDRRRTTALTDRGERPGESRVGDVVPGPRRQRPVLAVAGHPPDDEAGVVVEQLGGFEPQPLEDAGAEALDEDVRRGSEAAHDVDPVGMLEVHLDRAAPAVEDRHRQGGGPGPVDPDDVCAEIGEEHGAVGRRSQRRELDDPDSGERTTHVSSSP